jgi:hypothetical protein
MRCARIDATKAQNEEADKKRQDQLTALKTELQAELDNTRGARTTTLEFVKSQSPVAVAPGLLSGFILIGFFGLIGFLLSPWVKEGVAGFLAWIAREGRGQHSGAGRASRSNGPRDEGANRSSHAGAEDRRRQGSNAGGGPGASICYRDPAGGGHQSRQVSPRGDRPTNEVQLGQSRGGGVSAQPPGRSAVPVRQIEQEARAAGILKPRQPIRPVPAPARRAPGA